MFSPEPNKRQIRCFPRGSVPFHSFHPQTPAARLPYSSKDRWLCDSVSDHQNGTWSHPAGSHFHNIDLGYFFWFQLHVFHPLHHCISLILRSESRTNVPYGSVKQLSVELHADTRQNGRIGFSVPSRPFFRSLFPVFLQKLFLFLRQGCCARHNCLSNIVGCVVSALECFLASAEFTEKIFSHSSLIKLTKYGSAWLPNAASISPIRSFSGIEGSDKSSAYSGFSRNRARISFISERISSSRFSSWPAHTGSHRILWQFLS